MDRTLIEKLVKDAGFYNISQLKIQPTYITFEVETELKFDTLVMLSNVFNTTNIRFESEVKTAEYCSTCSYDYTVYTITISNYSL